MTVQYWHGGTPGLAVGARLLSPFARGAAYDPREPAAGGLVTRPDRVYFSTDREFARAYAFQTEIEMPSGALFTRGTLYRVEPVGRVDEDPDYTGHRVSWCSRSAIVCDVEEVDVRMRVRDAVRAIGPYMEWDDGRPVYHSDGRLSLSWQMKQLGLTQQQLDTIVRPWTRHDIALARVRASLSRASASSPSPI